MKSLKELRTSLVEHDLGGDRVPQMHSPGYSPPNILILKRKTVRAFSSTERVALYYSEKLGRYFSVPFTVGQPGADDVVGVSEEAWLPGGKYEKIDPPSKKYAEWAKKHGIRFEKPEEELDKAREARRLKKMQEEVIQEDAISHLQKVKAFSTSKPLYHKDGTETRVDAQTANALLAVHQSLHPDNKKKMADAMEHSKHKFDRLVDFAWKNVK